MTDSGEPHEPMVSVPCALFAEVIPGIKDLAEYKVVLKVAQLGAERRQLMVSMTDLLEPDACRSLLPLSTPGPREPRVRRAVEQAVANGTLLRLTPAGKDTMLLLGTGANRSLVQRLVAGDPNARQALHVRDEENISVYRGNVYALYEQHIGPLTPLIAEHVRDIERTYPRLWIEQAMAAAVQNNRRSWRYVESVLTQWEETGGPGGRGV